MFDLTRLDPQLALETIAREREREIARAQRARLADAVRRASRRPATLSALARAVERLARGGGGQRRIGLAATTSPPPGSLER